MAKILFLLMLVVVEVATAMTPAPSPGPAMAVDCSQEVMTLFDCLSFVQDGGTVMTKPEGTCCSSLKDMLKKSGAGDCLCEQFKNSPSLGISVNITKALSLPRACRLQTPSSVRNCAAISNAPGSEPSLAPRRTPGSSPNTPSGKSSPGKSVVEKLHFLILLPLVSSILLLIPNF